MGTNPFDVLTLTMEALHVKVCNELRALTDEVRAQAARPPVAAPRVAEAPAPVWESMAEACRTRHKGRGPLFDAIQDGRIRAKRVAGPGNGGEGKWLMAIVDLDKHFPIHDGGRKKRKPKEKPRPQRLGFSESLDSGSGFAHDEPGTAALRIAQN